MVTVFPLPKLGPFVTQLVLTPLTTAPVDFVIFCIFADNHKKLLNDFYNYQVSAIAEGKANKKERFFIMPNTRDKAGNHRLAT